MYIEDIFSFAVKTTIIFIDVMKVLILTFSRVRCKSENFIVCIFHGVKMHLVFTVKV